MTTPASTKVQLPLFEDPAPLPTGKLHISYSELADWIACSYRHKLKYIEQIDLDGPSIHTEYGQVLHDLLEEFILTQKPITEEKIEEAKTKLHELCLPLIESNATTVQEVEEFSSQIAPIALAVPDWLNTTFPGWQPVAAEFYLFEKIKEQTKLPRYFKGYVDAVIRVPKKKKKKSRSKKEEKSAELLLSEEAQAAVEYDIYILDWKTTSWGWMPDKKRDFNKQLQLMLYKHFWCEKFGMELSDVKCGFVLLKRTPKAGGSRCELVPVSLGPKTHPRAIALMNAMVNMVQSGRAIKNRMSCKYCVYHGTMHCP